MEFIQHLNEGFDLFYDKETNRSIVTITDLHQNGVDTSLDNNPQVYNVEMMINHQVETFPCISIFKRKPYKIANKDKDGNPVLYALKDENNYYFHSDDDKKFLIKRFKEILQKAFYKKDLKNCMVIFPQWIRIRNNLTGIAMPSSNELNDLIVKAIMEVNPNITFLRHLLRKINKEELYDMLTEPSSSFFSYWYHKGYNTEQITDLLYDVEMIFQNMPGDYYKKHFVKNSELRASIQHSMNINYNMLPLYMPNINGKDILLVDDTITYGQTLAEAISILRDNYSPKSITILTMFSKKMR